MHVRRQFLISPAYHEKNGDMEEMEPDTVRLVVGSFGLVSTLIFYLIPMKIFIRAMKKGSIREFSITPYTMRFFNCWCFMWYAMFFFIPEDELVGWANVLGSVISIFYIAVKSHDHFTASKDDNFFALVALGISFSLHILLYIAIAYLDREVRYYFWGTIVTSFTILMHACTTWKRIRLVIITETVEPISLVSSFFMFLNGLLWFAYGILFLGKDPVVSISYGVGCGVGAVELAMYVKYRENKVVFKLG